LSIDLGKYQEDKKEYERASREILITDGIIHKETMFTMCFFGLNSFYISFKLLQDLLKRQKKLDK